MNQQVSLTRTFLVRCVGAAASLGYGLLLADVLTPEAMGEFTIAVSMAVIAATVSKLGLDAYLTRHASGHPEQAARLTVRCLCAAGATGALAWVLCASAAPALFPAAGGAFTVLLLGIPILAMSYVLTGLLKAGDLPAAAVFLESGAWQSLMCACAMWMSLAGSGSPLLVAVWFAAGNALVLTGFLLVAWQLVFRGESPAPRPTRSLNTGMGEVAALAGISVGNVCMRWTDTLWLACWLAPAEVAVYVVCTRLASGIAIVDNVVNAVAAPRFARQFEEGETRLLRRELWRACAISGALGILGAGMLILFAPLALGWLGPPYSDAVGLLRLAAVAIAAQVALVPIGHLAQMSGRAVDHLKSVGLALALQQAAFVLLIPKFGMVAAVFGFAFSRVFVFLLTLALLRRRPEFGWIAG